jgi:hypothetical protein
VLPGGEQIPGVPFSVNRKDTFAFQGESRMTFVPAAAIMCLLLAQSTTPQPSAPSGATAPAAQSEAHRKVLEELTQLEVDLAEAAHKGDQAYFDSMMTDDFFLIPPSGAVRTKAQAIASLLKMADGAKESTPHEPPPDIVVRVLTDDTAVMTHGPGPGIVAHVFLKQEGKWRMASWISVQPPNPQK